MMEFSVELSLLKGVVFSFFLKVKVGGLLQTVKLRLLILAHTHVPPVLPTFDFVQLFNMQNKGSHIILSFRPPTHF